LAALAEQGAEANGFDNRFHAVTGDVRASGTIEAQAFDLVAINPPFRLVRGGVLSPLSEKALANHEVALALSEWLDVAAAAMRPMDGWPVFSPSIAGTNCAMGFRCAVLRSSDHARSCLRGHGPSRILVEARRGVVEARTEPPLIIHDGAGYSVEVRRMLGEDA